MVDWNDSKRGKLGREVKVRKMVKFVSAERVVDELHGKMLEHRMGHVEGDLRNLGKIKGLEEAVKIVSDLARRLR